jgi:NADPH2:quinone reductase
MTHAIRIHTHGGPEVLTWDKVAVGAPKAGEVRLRHTAIGVNFVDVYFRTGLYPAPAGLPFVPGKEAAGIVEDVGEGVADFKPGDRVVYCGPMGAYAEERIIAATDLVKLPENISDDIAVASMLKGMTAHYLLFRTFKVQAGDTILIHAAAGGVGLLVCQWASHLGANVIGTVGSADKAELARANGCHHTILYREEDVAERVKDITKGELCDVVYDSVGQAMYPVSLDCVKPLGMWVSFGQSSGPITGFTLGDLAKRGSLFATRPSLFHYIAKRADLESTAAALFDAIGSGILSVKIHERLPLHDAARAHRLLESRETSGSLILIP